MLPSPETVRDNVILSLPKLVEGMLLTSEFVDRGGNPDSYIEEYLAEVLAILSLEQLEQLEETDGRKVVLKYGLTFEAKRRHFSWNFLSDGRLPPRSEWHWEYDNGRFFRTILCAEIGGGDDKQVSEKTVEAVPPTKALTAGYLFTL